MRRLLSAWGIMGICLFGCAVEAEEDPATVDLGGACEMEEDYGGFVLQSAMDETGVEGSVANGVVPISVLESVGEQENCRVLRRNNPFCDPGCGPGETCDFDGTCSPYPANQDLGTVSLLGLNEEVEMEPVFPGNTYFNTSLSNPPFVGGELITLKMPKGEYGPLEVHGVGVDPLETPRSWVVESGVPLEVTWAAPTSEVVRSEVALILSIDQHGSTPGTVHCLFEDDGEAVVPGPIIEQLVSSGVTGFPSGLLERRTVDQVDLKPGCLDFKVTVPLVVDVDVVGFTPCLSTADCPEGQTCNVEMQVCE